MSSALLFFILISVVNVVTYTAKTILTVNGTKFSASAINSVNSVVYLLFIIYTVTDVPLLPKVLITAFCNFVGVYIIKLVEEKLRKDKLWKIEATIKREDLDSLKLSLDVAQLPYNYIDVNKYIIFNIYCATQVDSRNAKLQLDKVNAKYFVSQSETLL